MQIKDSLDDHGQPSKRGFSTAQDVGRRTRFHARTLMGRVYRPGGETILLVRGSPDAESLRRCLVDTTDSQAIDELTPALLGFASSDAMPIHRGGLASRARSVQRWRYWIEKRFAGPVSATRRQELSEEWHEVESLGARVAELHQVIAAAEVRPTPFWLEPGQERDYSDALRDRLAGRHFPEEVTSLARLIHWIAGIAATRRFLDAVKPGLLTIEQHRERLAVQKFLDVLTELETRRNAIEAKAGATVLQRNKAKIAAFRTTIREAGPLPRLQELFDALPNGAKTPDRIFLPGRHTEIDLDLTLRRTRKVLEELPKPPDGKMIRWLALFCLTDDKTTPIAWAPFESAKKTGIYRIERLWGLRTEPGYRPLLENLNRLPLECDYVIALKFLATGGGVDDFEWLDERNALGHSAENHGAAAQPFRAIVTWLEANDAPLSKDRISNLWASTATKPGTVLLESLARFLQWLPRPSRQQVGEFATLLDILAHPSQRTAMIDRLRSWANPPARPRLPAGCPDALREELAPEVRRLAYYQRLAGQKARIPGSIRGIIESQARQTAEIEHLRALGDRANPAQSQRLAHLAKRIDEPAGPAHRTHARLIRQIREVSVVAALEAVKGLIRAEIQIWWSTRFGVEPDLGAFRWQDLFGIVRWADRLPETSREAVNAIMHAHRQHGPAWRRALPQNEAWLKLAGGSIEIESWLNPAPMRFEIDGKQLILKAAADPVDIFLMGSRFETCLNLNHGINAFSVIANAADANKNVIYAFRPDGTPIARKLVGVRSDWKLVGNRLYAHEPSPALEGAFARFCGIWAARSGLGLANAGVPPTLGPNRWYDDRTVAWPDECFTAYRETRPDAAFESSDPHEPTLERLHQAVAMIPENRPAAISALKRLNQTWGHSAAFWQVVAGATPSLTATVMAHDHWVAEYGDFFRNATAAGLAGADIDPRRFSISADQFPVYWAERACYTLALMPTDRNAISKAASFLMRMPEHRDEWYSNSCFEACLISPALATLPFGRIVRLLLRFTDFFGPVPCGCGAIGVKMWAKVLRMAWIRQSDSTAFAQAFERAGPRAFEILLEFCESCPDWRFAGPIGRRLRATSENTMRAKLQQIRERLGDLADDHREGEPPWRDEALPFDPSASFECRRDALIERAGRTATPDAFAGTLLCAEWTHAERAMLPIETRRGFAAEMATQGHDEEWKTWPLLHWLATLPEADRFEILMRANETKSQYVLAADGEGWITLPGPLKGSAWPVVFQALGHAEIDLRHAAEAVFRATVRRAPDIRDALIQFAGPWIWPETCARLGEILRGETTAT